MWTKDPLDRVLRIAQVAEHAGWVNDKMGPQERHSGILRMRRHLEALNRELHGMLLVNIAQGKERACWTVTLRAIRRVHPQWFPDAEIVNMRLIELEQLAEKQAEQIQDLMSRLHTTERVTDMHTKVLAKAKKAA